MENNPKVTAVIPFYNGVEWLYESVQSVIDQTYQNIEIIVVNDGSPEDVTEFLAKYGARIKYFYKENGGVSTARNLAIKNATGKYIALLDSDDIWLPEKTSIQVDFMEKTGAFWSNTGFCYWWPSTNKTKEVDTKYTFGNIVKQSYVSLRLSTPSVMYRKEIFDDNKFLFDESLRRGQDTPQFRLVGKYWPLALIERPLMYVRMRGNNTNMRAALRIKLKASQSPKELDSTVIKCIFMIYRFENRIMEFVQSQFKPSYKIENFIAKCLWSLPYAIERIYLLWICHNKSKLEGQWKLLSGNCSSEKKNT